MKKIYKEPKANVIMLRTESVMDSTSPGLFPESADPDAEVLGKEEDGYFGW